MNDHSDVVSDAGPRFHEDAVRSLVALALAEDRVDRDVTSRALVPTDARATGALVAREAGVVCGLALLEDRAALREAFPDLAVEARAADGDAVADGDILAVMTGAAQDVLAIERTALNFLQRLSGIATATSRFVAAAVGSRARIQETRKTCPGWRSLDKYAVRCGGGLNHRASLADMILIKENHLVFAGEPMSADGIREGLRRARAADQGVAIEIEVENLDQFDAALAEAPDVIMLDEFSNEQVREAVRRRDAVGPPPPLIEVSGSVRLERVRSLADLGVDRISVGALTHSVSALDLALDVEIRT